MDEVEETLKISIVAADYPTKRLIFYAWTDEDSKPSLGVATCDEESNPMWTFRVNAWPPIHKSTYEALTQPHFQDFFSLLFMQYHKFGFGVLYVRNECGNVSFSVKPE